MVVRKKPAAPKPAPKPGNKKPAPKPGAKKPAGKKENNSGVPTIRQPGAVDFTSVTASQMSDVSFDPTNVDFNVDQVSADTVSADTLADRFMTAADYQMVDPAEVAAEFGDINREQIRTNAGLANDIAMQQLETELKGLQNFVPAMAELKRSQTAADNAFNQAQRDAQLAAADPNLRADLMAQRERANRLASGRLLSSIEDRSLELGIRSRAADSAGAGGFGARSSAARKASELMSAEQRLAIAMQGEQLLTSNIGNRNALLLSPTAYSDAGAQVNINPSQSVSALAQGALGDINQRTTLDVAQALQSKVQQNQFSTELEQDTRKTNLSVAAQRDAEQARLNLQAGSTNAANRLQAGMANQDASLRAQMSAAQIRSQENQFTTQLSWNTANANAQRQQEAGMFNSEMGFKAASANRDVNLDVQKFNKNLIFQDQQARRAEAAANARAAAAERGASARAAMSASLQREQMAISIAEREKDRAFALAQQQQTMEMYQSGRQQGQASANAGAVGTAISRVPTIINGVNAIGQTISTIGNMFSSSSTDTPVSDALPSGNFDTPDFSLRGS